MTEPQNIEVEETEDTMLEKTVSILKMLLSSRAFLFN